MPGRAGPSRSRSQRDPQPSQSQRIHGRRADSEDEDGSDDDAPEMDLDEEMDPEPTQGRRGDEDGGDFLEKKARDLVRLALFSEHKRVPLRREDINKKVLGAYSRSFNAVLIQTQALLRKTFAMELVELQSRNYRDQGPGEDQNATGVRKKATATGSKTYILRSTLDPVIIEQAALSDERLLEEEIAEGNDDEDDEDMPRDYGSIIAWSTADQLGALGQLHVILALILISGRVMSELDLRANLKRLRIMPNGTIPSNAQSTHRAMTIDIFLQQLVRQGYLDRVRTGESKAATGKRRERVSATQGVGNGEDNAHAYEWRWGNRAHAEIGEQAVAGFVGEFMVERMGLAEDEEEEEEVGGRRKGKQKQKEGMEKRLETMLKAIERAAGGNLSDAK